MSDTGAEASHAQQRLAELRQTYPLPAPWCWSDDDLLLDRAEVGPLTLFMVGVVARAGVRHGRERDNHEAAALGAACECETYPVDRAYFELLERISVLEARRTTAPLSVRALDGTELSQRDGHRVFPADLHPMRQRLSLSNGVALHTTWAAACAAALHELIERDRVLRAWQGQCARTVVATEGALAATRLQSHYSVRAYEFGSPYAGPSDALDPSNQRRVIGLFLFPHTKVHPLVYGFAAATQASQALARAETEALQRLAFLWGEPLPERAPDPAPQPDYHQDYYLYPPNHAHIVRWLDGEHGVEAREPRRSARLASPALYEGERTQFIDLTPEPLRGKLAVAKALSSHARRLRFGAPHARDEGVPHPIV